MQERRELQYAAKADSVFPVADQNYPDGYNPDEVVSPFETAEPPLPPNPDPLAEKAAQGAKFVTGLIYRFEDNNGRKTPDDRTRKQSNLRRRYGVRGPVQFDTVHSEFIFTSRTTDPPPPSHDIGEVDLADLEELSRDPEVLEIFVEEQSIVQQGNDEDAQTRVVRDHDEETRIIEDEQHIVAEESFSTSDGQVVTFRVTTEDIDDQITAEEAKLKMRDPAFQRAYSPRLEERDLLAQDYELD